MRHVILISTSYPSDHDGSEAAGSFVADFAETLAAQLQVTVLAPGLNSEREQTPAQANLRIRRFQLPYYLPLSLLKPYNPLAWPEILRTLSAGRSALAQIVQQEHVDHIFALWVLPSGYWAKQASVEYGIPYSTWALGSDIWSLGKVPFIKSILKRVLRASQANFADGYLLKTDVEHLSGRSCTFLPSTRRLEIPDLPPLASEPPYRLAFLGRWHLNKGIDLLLDSLNLLDEEDWARIAEVRIAGGGPLKDKVHNSCAALQSQNRPVLLQGYLDKPAAINWLGSADYVLIPSRVESIPVVFSDAMQCRRPVISTPVGDLTRLLPHYQAGVLADAVSPAAFAQAIKLGLNNKPEHFTHGLRQGAEDFSLPAIAETLLRCIFPKQ